MVEREFRFAEVTVAPKATTTVRCRLEDGIEIIANCRICGGGSALNVAVPRLSVGDKIIVMKNDGYWHCTTTFMASMVG